MDDQRFLSRINSISRDHGLMIPAIQEGEPPSGALLERWAQFLEACVKQSISLADPRWQRLNAEARRDHTRFYLEDGAEPPSDPDFRVGLQLLMGMLEKDGEPPS